MGHTVRSQRGAVDITLSELKQFGHALRQDDRRVLEDLLKEPMKYVGAMSYAGSLNIWAFVLLAVLIEQEKRLAGVERSFRDPSAVRPHDDVGMV